MAAATTNVRRYAPEIGSPNARTSVTLVRAFGDPVSSAYRLTFLVAAGICVLAAAIGWFVPGPAPPARPT